MKVLAFTDLHGQKTALKKLLAKAKKEKPDIVLCAGDYTIFQRDNDKILKEINKMGKVYLIHGNHETERTTRNACKKYKNITYADKKIIKLGPYTLVSIGGGGFSKRDKDFEEFIKKNEKKLKGKIILMTHGPPYKTKLDYLEQFKEHVGCESYTKFIKKYKPAIAVSGHLHENEGKEDRMGKTILINPGITAMIKEI